MSSDLHWSRGCGSGGIGHSGHKNVSDYKWVSFGIAWQYGAASVLLLGFKLHRTFPDSACFTNMLCTVTGSA